MPKVQKTNFLIFPPEKFVFDIHELALYQLIAEEASDVKHMEFMGMFPAGTLLISLDMKE